MNCSGEANLAAFRAHRDVRGVEEPGAMQGMDDVVAEVGYVDPRLDRYLVGDADDAVQPADVLFGSFALIVPIDLPRPRTAETRLHPLFLKHVSELDPDQPPRLTFERAGRRPSRTRQRRPRSRYPPVADRTAPAPRFPGRRL